MLEPIATVRSGCGNVYDVMSNGEWHLSDYKMPPMANVSRICDCPRCLKYNQQTEVKHEAASNNRIAPAVSDVVERSNAVEAV